MAVVVPESALQSLMRGELCRTGTACGCQARWLTQVLLKLDAFPMYHNSHKFSSNIVFL